MRARAGQRMAWTFACAVIAACGDGGGDAGDSSSSSSSDEGSEPTGAAMDTSSEGGEVATGTCTSWATAGAKSDVFIPAEGASPDACGETVDACGGDPHGTWTLDDSCGYDMTPLANPLAESCPGGYFSAMPPTRSGTLSVDESGHFTLHTATVHAFTFEADVECFGTFNCDASVAAALMQDGGTASCSGGPTDCTCMVTGIEKDAVSADGQLRGADALALTGAGKAYPFCASTGRLELWTLPGGPMATGTSCAVDADCATMDPGALGICLPG